MGLTRPRAHQLQDIDYKQSVRVVSVSNVTLSGGAPSVVDGVSVTIGDRVLVAGQSTGSENGLYYVTTVGTGNDGTWTRTSDANETGEISAGMIVMVTEGTTYADTQWKLVTNDPITVGTTALVFQQNSAAAYGNIYANGTAIIADAIGDTLTLTPGNNLIITGNATSDTVTFAVSDAPTFTGNITGEYFIGNGSQLTGITSEKVILAIGDSWIATSEWTAAAERAFQRTVVNQAVGGRTSTDVLANLATDVAAAGGYESISLVVLGVGGNDKLAANSATISAANSTLYANLGNILAEITGNSVPVIMSPAPFVDGDDLEAGLPPDNVQFIDTGLYYDDPEYANIALSYPGVSVATNAMSYLIDNPDKFLIDGGFHPNDTTGVETYVNIIASAAQGLTEYSLNAAIGQTLDLLIFNSGIELGRTTSVNTPYIDFHTSGNANVDYDSRIVASGGDAVNNGTGNLTIYAGVANIVGNVVGQYFIGNGSQLTGLPAGYANSDAVAYGEAGWAGNIIPSANVTYSLGNLANQWKDVFVGPGSLYINGQKVLEDSAGTIVVQADADQGLTVKTSGTGITTVQSAAGLNLTTSGTADITVTTANGQFEIDSNIIINSSKTINSSDAGPITFGDGVSLGNNEITNVTTLTASGNITGGYFIGDGSQLTGISADTIGGNLTVLTRSSGNVKFDITAGYITVLSRTGNVQFAVSP